MNDVIRSDLKVIRELLQKEELVKEYLSLKSQIDSSKEIRNIQNKMKFYKKCNMSDEDRSEYYEAKKALDNDPLLLNFLETKKEVDHLKKEIKEILKL